MDKYKQFILDIIINRGRFAIPDDEYKEEHHIVPKCMGGTNDKENLVHLYAREHIVAHKLLTEIYPNHKGVFNAFWQMCNYRKYNKYITPEEYERAKKKKSKVQSKAMKEYHQNNPEAARRINRDKMRPVVAIDTKSSECKYCFVSTREAELVGLKFDHSNIVKCCKGKHGYKTHKGYEWYYVKDWLALHRGGDNNDSDN